MEHIEILDLSIISVVWRDDRQMVVGNKELYVVCYSRGSHGGIPPPENVCILQP
jgi:hypothetical protein